MPQPWQPMLEGGLAERAWEAIQDIAEDLKDPPEHGMDSDPQARSLAAGVTGSALFLGYLAQVTGNDVMEERACDHLVAAQQAAASSQTRCHVFEPYSEGMARLSLKLRVGHFKARAIPNHESIGAAGHCRLTVRRARDHVLLRRGQLFAAQLIGSDLCRIGRATDEDFSVVSGGIPYDHLLLLAIVGVPELFPVSLELSQKKTRSLE